ncbi:MAG: 3-deoxy-manno-octulosonate cytidylyltransferase [Nitrospinae bacterium]|nr:3-deoxy-manno-octulosonate cytidylyltransferase [Nitrospinota bacterium]
MKITAVIPARYGSTRFPGKVLAMIQGKPMVQWVYEKAARASLVERVLVATDDERVAEAVRSFGGDVRMTAKTHPSGTDRIAEVARDLSSDILVNVQGDEPGIEPVHIDLVANLLLQDPGAAMATLASRITAAEEHENPNVVKVVFDQKGHALYFSRYGIPFNRDGLPRTERYKHIGLYSYRREFILKFVGLPPTPLERMECLEQLRALENGYKIRVGVTEYSGVGVDTPEDLERISRIGLVNLV